MPAHTLARLCSACEISRPDKYELYPVVDGVLYDRLEGAGIITKAFLESVLGISRGGNRSRGGSSFGVKMAFRVKNGCGSGVKVMEIL